MLVPAILYKKEIQTKMLEYNYTEDMMYYSGYLGNSLPSIEENNDGSLYQYAIIENRNRDSIKLIGYFTYQIDWYSSCVYNFGLFSFDRNNVTIGLDVYRELKKIINDFHIHRIEWRMISGNPVEKHYDKFCEKYNGKKFVFTDTFKDRCGKYHNSVVYEIIFEHSKSTTNTQEIVRCKDCVLKNSDNCAMSYNCNCGEQYSWETDNDYCSWGLKRS